MTLLAFSDVVIGATLWLNALCLMSNGKLSREDGELADNGFLSRVIRFTCKKSMQILNIDPQSEAIQRILHTIAGLRAYSFLIVIWNIIWVCLMVFVFREQ